MREVLAGLLVLALLFGWVQSCRLGTAQDSLDAHVADLAACRAESRGLARTLSHIDKLTADALAEAEARVAAAQDAAARAEQAEQEAAARQAAATKALRNAMRDPACAEQLEVELCSAIPLL